MLVNARCFDLAERHDLDECNPDTTRVRPTNHRFKLIFVHPLERDDIDFHREPRALGGANPREHAIEIATPGDRLELVGIESIERNVDPTNAADRPTGVCERVTTRWPNRRWKPGSKNGAI